MGIDELNNIAMQTIKEMVAVPLINDKEHLLVTLGEVHGVIELVDELIKRRIEGEAFEE